MSKTNFAGDVLFVCGNDGGELVIEDGLVCDTAGLGTAVYLSLFGGNENDTQGRGKQTWWGNLLQGVKDNERLVSRLQATAKAMPMASGNLRKAEQAAADDLNWLVGLAADEVSAEIFATSMNSARLDVKCKISTGGEFSQSYSIDEWGVQGV